MRKNIVIIFVVLIAGILATHFVDNHKANKTTKETLVTEVNKSRDFNDLLNKYTKGRLDCSIFRDKVNIDQCKATDRTRD